MLSRNTVTGFSFRETNIMIPVFIILASPFVVTVDRVHQVVAAIELFAAQNGIPFVKALEPFHALLLAAVLVYLPAGLKTLYAVLCAKLNNVDPRKSSQQMSATHPLYARLQACHDNLLECYPFLAAGVLAALQAGVDKTTVGEFATLWCVSRVLFIFFYTTGSVLLLSGFRSMSWGMSVMLQTQLMVLAAGIKV